jgi:hypothetical protein
MKSKNVLKNQMKWTFTTRYLHYYCTNPDSLHYRDTSDICDALRLRRDNSTNQFQLFSFLDMEFQ